MIISHYNVIVWCRQLAPASVCARCVAAYSWDDQQYDPCGTCTGRMSMPRPPPQHFYDYTLPPPHPSLRSRYCRVADRIERLSRSSRTKTTGKTRRSARRSDKTAETEIGEKTPKSLDNRSIIRAARTRAVKRSLDRDFCSPCDVTIHRTTARNSLTYI